MFIPSFPAMPTVVPGSIVLIDGDMVNYTAAAVFEEDTHSNNVKIEVDRRIEQAMTETGAELYDFFITHRTNFRDGIATFNQYKGSRYNPDGTRKMVQPKHLAAAKAHSVKRHGAILLAGHEADDLLGIYSNIYKSDGKVTTISSGDKDLRINIGQHHNPRDGSLELVQDIGYITGIRNPSDNSFKVKGAGLTFFLYQLLAGDATDGIPGLPKIGEGVRARFGVRRGGCGPSKAHEILSDGYTLLDLFTSVRAAYWDYFNTHGLYNHWLTGVEQPGYDDFLIEQGRLLWMRQTFDELWVPPKEWMDYSDKHMWRYL
jgi:5'-3' exonuclease